MEVAIGGVADGVGARGVTMRVGGPTVAVAVGRRIGVADGSAGVDVGVGAVVGMGRGGSVGVGTAGAITVAEGEGEGTTVGEAAGVADGTTSVGVGDTVGAFGVPPQATATRQIGSRITSHQRGCVRLTT